MKKLNFDTLTDPGLIARIITGERKKVIHYSQLKTKGLRIKRRKNV